MAAAESVTDLEHRHRALEAAHRGTRSELATYTSEVAALRRDVTEMRAELVGLRELVEAVHSSVQTTARQSLQVQQSARRAQHTAAALGPSLLVLFELGRWLLEHFR